MEEMDKNTKYFIKSLHGDKVYEAIMFLIKEKVSICINMKIAPSESIKFTDLNRSIIVYNDIYLNNKDCTVSVDGKHSVVSYNTNHYKDGIKTDTIDMSKLVAESRRSIDFGDEFQNMYEKFKGTIENNSYSKGDNYMGEKVLIDWTKPIETEDGQEWELIYVKTNLDGSLCENPYFIRIKDSSYKFHCSADGKIEDYQFRLRNRKEKVKIDLYQVIDKENYGKFRVAISNGNSHVFAKSDDGMVKLIKTIEVEL